MRGKLLTITAALAVLCSTQNVFAVNLNTRGLGGALIYPYYTVNKGQDTLISVGNSSDAGKALHVLLLEGYNGREVLGFNLYLAPHDVWTASVSQTEDDGGGVITTSDRSCTDPLFTGVAFSLRTADFDGTDGQPADAGPQSAERTREGSIEIIEMGDIDPDSQLAQVTAHAANGGAPACGVTDAIASAGVKLKPTGGLFGSASIVDISEGTFFSYNADALQGFSDKVLYVAPVDNTLTLRDANSADSAVGGAIAYVSTEGGHPMAIDYKAGEDAVSAVFMADSIQNDYLVGGGFGANTDWIVTFPTKRFYTDSRYGAVPKAPFAHAFAAPGQADVQVETAVYDREASASALAQNGLRYVVNVVPYQNAPSDVTGVFGSLLASANVSPHGADGYASIDLASGDGGHQLRDGVDSAGGNVTLMGLPVAGFMAYNVINANAQPGMLANYGATFRHRSTFSCSSSFVAECAD